MAHAAKETLVTVEQVRPGDLLADETLAAGTLPALYVTALAEAPQRRLAPGPRRTLRAGPRPSRRLCPACGERGGLRPLIARTHVTGSAADDGAGLIAAE